MLINLFFQLIKRVQLFNRESFFAENKKAHPIKSDELLILLEYVSALDLTYLSRCYRDGIGTFSR